MKSVLKRSRGDSAIIFTENVIAFVMRAQYCRVPNDLPATFSDLYGSGGNTASEKFRLNRNNIDLFERRIIILARLEK